MTKDDKEIVSALRASLADKVGTTRFELWFGPATRLTVQSHGVPAGQPHGQLYGQSHGLLIEVPTLFMQNWLRSNFRKELEAACAEVLGEIVPLEFRVDESLSANANGSNPATALVPTVAPAAGSSQSVDGSAAANVASVNREPNSLPRVPFQRKFASLDTFVVGSGNRMAEASVKLAVEKVGQVSPLFLYGPTGVGKTHLLEGVWSALRSTRRDVVVMYLSAEQFTTQFLDALHRTGLPSFRAKLRRVDVLIIDDVQFFAGKKATLTELQHTIDTLLRAGKQLIFAADQAPGELVELGKELSSRLAGGLVCGLEPADHQTRLGILRHLVVERKMNVPNDVLEYIAGHLTSHARELSGALNRLQASSLCIQQPITKALAEEALNELIRGGRGVQLRDIEAAVCKTLGLQPDSLQSDRKAKNISYPRMLAMWLARKHTRVALSEIGHFFGNRSHSTVISASKTVAAWMTSQSQVALADHTWPIEDAIRRVEQNLRLG